MRLAIALSGGGAHAAYEAGVLRTLVRAFPDVHFDIITGVSSGAINALYLASQPGPLSETVGGLVNLWADLHVDDVFCADTFSLVKKVGAWALQLISGGTGLGAQARGLVDTAPLRDLLTQRLTADQSGAIPLGPERQQAVAIVTLNYTTGQTITWINGDHIAPWERPLRRSVVTEFTVDHIMASCALPLVFPAVQIDGMWYGDGGIRLVSPLSPALQLGADRILAISTNHEQSLEEANQQKIAGYPPPAQILGQLMNAIFVDLLQEDALRLERSNEFLRDLPPDKRNGYRVIDLLVIRPSRDLAKLALKFEQRLPRGFRFMMRGLGTRRTARADFLSVLLFQRDYLRELIAIGAEDCETRLEDVAKLLSESTAS